MIVKRLKSGWMSFRNLFRRKPCEGCARLAYENEALQAALSKTYADYQKATRLRQVASPAASMPEQGIGMAPAYPADNPTVLPPLGADPRWAHLKASVIGCGKSELQDSHAVVVHGDTVVLIVSDGAGSRRLSKEGADFTTSILANRFRALVRAGHAFEAQGWPYLASKLFLEVSEGLTAHADSLECTKGDLGCTCIVVFSNASFSACSHVGDGRAGLLDSAGAWKSLLDPYKGQETNATVFLTMLNRSNSESIVRHRVEVGSYRAVVALSDGPESVCWHVSTLNQEGDKLVDPNLPSGDFFGKITNQLAQASSQQTSQADLDRSWAKFLTDGNPQLASETDDKTLLIALRV